LLPLVIAQKKMHLRGIELETSSLECLEAAAATNQA
jgi:tRNA/tmRNA/rRNA uracil-C5-methylase (TrmA/RlmC/RlmD family)